MINQLSYPIYSLPNLYEIWKKCFSNELNVAKKMGVEKMGEARALPRYVWDRLSEKLILNIYMYTLYNIILSAAESLHTRNTNTRTRSLVWVINIFKTHHTHRPQFTDGLYFHYYHFFFIILLPNKRVSKEVKNICKIVMWRKFIRLEYFTGQNIKQLAFVT